MLADAAAEAFLVWAVPSPERISNHDEHDVYLEEELIIRIPIP